MPWIYGKHAVISALQNPNREHCKLIINKSFDRTQLNLEPHHNLLIETVDLSYFDQQFNNANHQGIALNTRFKQNLSYKEIPTSETGSLVVVLDQLTDPHNVGAIIRTAAAFQAQAIIITHHNSATITNPIITKISSGGTEQLPIITTKNLASTLDHLKGKGFWCIGLDEDGTQNINNYDLTGNIAIVIGSEGKGLRRLTKEKCDLLLTIPTNPVFSTLNASNAAAVSCYEYYRQNGA